MGSNASLPLESNGPKPPTLDNIEQARKEDAEKNKCKPCCACPETRKARDLCIVERGEEECKDLIEAHKECMRKLGYVVG